MMKRILLCLLLGALPVRAAYVCAVDPVASTNLTYDLLFFTVTVTSNNLPVEGVSASFVVTSGPNSGEADLQVTDFNGEAVFYYISDGATGKDTIQVSIAGVPNQCSATAVWAETINEPPLAFCQDAVVAAGGLCAAEPAASILDDGSFDPDGEIVAMGLTPAGPYPLGTNLVTLTVTDDGGYSDSCQANLIVVDLTGPAVLCPIQVVTNVAAGITEAPVTFATPAALDNCSDATVSCSPPSGSLFPVGVTPVICTGVDSDGNTNECSFDVIVNADPAPGHDLTIAKLKAPKTITLSATVTQVTGLAVVTIVNLGDHIETINSYDGLVTLVAQSLSGNCPDGAVALHNGTPNKPLPILLAPRKKLNIAYDVTINCALDPLKGIDHQDYRVLATVNHPALGTGPDSNPGNDDCPRPPNLLTGDKGCGGKGGTTVFIDVAVK